MLRHAPLALVLLALSCHKVPAALPEPDSGGPGPSGPGVIVERSPEREGSRLFSPMTAEAASLYRCWFESPYEYMFDRGSSTLEVGGREFGMLMAGISGILYYGDLNDCAGRLVDRPPNSYSDIRPLELLAGVSATRPDASLPFDSVNPEFVWWARRELLPAPEQSIDGISVQLAYERVFQRFFRLMSESLMMIEETSDVAKQARVYLLDSQSQDGIEWLESHYTGVPGHGGSWDGTTMTAPMAVGFWLRRELDGSLPACWHGLRDVLERYDSAWLDQLRAHYPRGAGKLAQLPDDMPAGGPG